MLTVWMAFSLRFELWHSPVGNQWLIYLLAPVLMIPVFIYAGLYRVVYRHSGFSAFITLIQASAAYGLLFICVLFFLNVPGVPHSIGVLQPMISLLIIGGSRGFVKFWYINNDIKEQKGVVKEKLIIYGAGSAGVEIMNAINRSKKYDLVGFVDDEKQLHGRTINGMKVYSFTQAEDLIVQQGISNILLAMPSVSRVRRSEIVNKFKKFPVHIQMLPGFEELVDGRVSISDIKEIQIEDLLGRDPVPVNNALVNEIIEGRVVLVTGAGGSIGSELCRQLLAANPSKLLLVDNAEHNLYIINNDLQRRRLRINSITEVVPLLGDVTDENRMAEICSVFEPSVIYHAAAYKHVPMVEHNPVQGVRNNVLGTLTVAEVALQYGVSSVVLVSTDKAVRPTNVMGASKRFCEMIFQALAEELGHSTCFSMVRFGNVLGSSGSVVPLFRQQIKEGGPLTITHEEITRYFMTIPEAAQLIIQAGAMASGGDVYLLDMGEPIKIVDLARRMVELSGLSVRDIEFSYTGLRPGEKLYEELLIGNNPEPTQNSRIFKANEDFVAWPKLLRELGELTFAISNNDVDSIKRHLMRLIPEYQTNSKTTDYVALEQKNQCLNIALCA
ncbi:MAG: polysaccharide biosynthesis protein [Chlorobiaceae bacterium]|nr:polysaccharide biosynthesis protein [Chlorobiaceae bacterium]